MDVDGVTTAPRKRPAISSKTGSLSLSGRIAFGAVAIGVPLMAFALLFAMQDGAPGAAGPGDAGAEDDGNIIGAPDPPGDDALPADDLDGDGLPDAPVPDTGNLTEDPGLPQ